MIFVCYKEHIVSELVSEFGDLCVWLYRPTVISLKMCFLYQSESTPLCSSQFVMKTKMCPLRSSQALIDVSLWGRCHFCPRVLSSGTDAASPSGTRSEPPQWSSSTTLFLSHEKHLGDILSDVLALQLQLPSSILWGKGLWEGSLFAFGMQKQSITNRGTEGRLSPLQKTKIKMWGGPHNL